MHVALTPPDPTAQGVWYPGASKPFPLNISPGCFKPRLSNCCLRRYMEGVEGLVHVTEMSEDYNIRIEDFVTVVGLCTLESS